MTSSLTLLLEQQLQQLVQMNELLLCERDAFTSRDSAKIEAVNQQKIQALEELKLTDEKIVSQFNETDFDNEDVRQLKSLIDDALNDVKQQNDVNGKIISHSQVNLNMLKEVLISNTAGARSKKDRSAMTYNQTGKKSSLIKGKPIKA